MFIKGLKMGSSTSMSIIQVYVCEDIERGSGLDEITMIMAIEAIGAGLIVVGVVVHLSRLPTRIGCKEVGAGHWGTHTHHLVEEFEGRTKMKWGHGLPPATVAPLPVQALST